MQIVLEGNNLDFLQNLDDFTKSEYQKAIVIGIPGIGKTYNCKYFANNHGLSEQYYNLANFIFKQNTQNNFEQWLLSTEDNQIIFFDEWEHSLNNNYDIQMYLSRILQICQKKQNKIIFITQIMDVNKFQLKFDQILKLELPSFLFRLKLINQSLANDEQISQKLAQLTEYYTPMEILTIIRQIQMEPLKRFVQAKYHKMIDVDGKQLLAVAQENDENLTILDMVKINGDNIILNEINIDDMIIIVKQFKPISLEIN